MIIHYRTHLKNKSRILRGSGTLSEALMWNRIKARKIRGYQFNRQKPIGGYIVDFYCGKLRLVIEIDGCTHRDKFAYDKARQEKLEAMGLHVMRFQDEHVKSDIGSVIQTIETWIQTREKLIQEKVAARIKTPRN